MKCTVQVDLGHGWIDCAEFEVDDLVVPLGAAQGRGRLSYLEGYFADYLGARDAHSLSVSFPVGPDFLSTNTGQGWPFPLLDLLPAGAARRTWLRRLGIDRDSFGEDWNLLLAGAGNPPGNIRIKEAAQEESARHPGFLRKEVLARKEDFIEYAERMGAPVAGTSGAQGDAPKFLLVEDAKGRWHAEGSVPSSKVKRHWLVKFPRGKTSRDREILAHEAVYSAVAKALGLDVKAPSTHEKGVLFVPRFDRKPLRGLESLACAAGLRDASLGVRHEKLIRVIAEASSKPELDVIEYVRRDILNVLLGNTDNHARNTALLKDFKGGVRLSPFYDCAPMFWDEQMIPRAIRWRQNTRMAIWPASIGRASFLLQRRRGSSSATA